MDADTGSDESQRRGELQAAADGLALGLAAFRANRSSDGEVISFSGLAWNRAGAQLLGDLDFGFDEAQHEKIDPSLRKLESDMPALVDTGFNFDMLIHALQQATGARDEMVFLPKSTGGESVYRISSNSAGDVVVVVVNGPGTGDAKVLARVNDHLTNTMVLSFTCDPGGELFEIFGHPEEVIGWNRSDLLSGSISLFNLFEDDERPAIMGVLRRGGEISVTLRAADGNRFRCRFTVEAAAGDQRLVTLTMGPLLPSYLHADPLTGSRALDVTAFPVGQLKRVVLCRIDNLDRCAELYTDEMLKILWTRLVRSIEGVAGVMVAVGSFGEIVTIASPDRTTLVDEVMNSYPVGRESPFRFVTAEATGRWPGVLAAARRSLRVARRTGVPYRFADDSGGTHRDDEVLAELPGALEIDEPVLHYQPIVDAETGAVRSVEALFRWTSPKLGVVNPGELVPLLVGSPLQGQLDRWVINHAAAVAREIGDTHGVRVWVNITPALVTDGTLVPTLQRACAGLPEGSLGIEITEHESIGNIALHASQLQVVRDLGVHVGLDDFGTGSSSLSYAANLPCDELKIDGSFVKNLPDGREAASVCRAIASLGSGLGVPVCAEMVETVEQATMLRLLGVELLQGWLFAKALPLEQLVELLDSGVPLPAK